MVTLGKVIAGGAWVIFWGAGNVLFLAWTKGPHFHFVSGLQSRWLVLLLGVLIFTAWKFKKKCFWQLCKVSWIMGSEQGEKKSREASLKKARILINIIQVFQEWYHSTLNHTFLLVWRRKKKENNKDELINFVPKYHVDRKCYIFPQF